MKNFLACCLLPIVYCLINQHITASPHHHITTSAHHHITTSTYCLLPIAFLHHHILASAYHPFVTIKDQRS
jgi:hypothetical protein